MTHIQASEQLAWDDPTSGSSLPPDESASNEDGVDMDEMEDGLG